MPFSYRSTTMVQCNPVGCKEELSKQTSAHALPRSQCAPRRCLRYSNSNKKGAQKASGVLLMDTNTCSRASGTKGTKERDTKQQCREPERSVRSKAKDGYVECVDTKHVLARRRIVDCGECGRKNVAWDRWGLISPRVQYCNQ